MDLQEIFDTTIRKVIEQGCPSGVIEDFGTVGDPFFRFRGLYRDDEGHRCASGFWVPDDQYSIEMENKSPTRIARDVSSRVFSVLSIYVPLLTDMQRCHDIAAKAALDRGNGTIDNSAFLSRFLSEARNVAGRRGLDVTVLNELTTTCPLA